MIKFAVLVVLFFAVAINANAIPPKATTVADPAAEARRLVHQANWASVATISTNEATPGFPMVNLLSTADSEVDAASTGRIYFYMLNMDTVAKDTTADNRISFMFSDAQEGACNNRKDDPWSHKCPKTIITGQVKKLEAGTEEYDRGMKAFLSRHVTAANWGRGPPERPHVFNLCELEISNVVIFAEGTRGYLQITPAEYYAGAVSVKA